MSVLDTLAAVDFLLGDEGAAAIGEELSKGPAAAPDLLADLGDIRVEFFPAMSLRERAWELRENLTAADALFVALAERLGEPLLTRDRALAAAAGRHAGVETVALG